MSAFRDRQRKVLEEGEGCVSQQKLRRSKHGRGLELAKVEIPAEFVVEFRVRHGSSSRNQSAVTFTSSSNAAGRRVVVGSLPYHHHNFQGVWRDACLQVLLERYLPSNTIRTELRPEIRCRLSGPTETVCSTWVVTAYRIAHTFEGELLRDALLSTSLGVIGRERNDPRFLVASLRTYQTALKRVRSQLAALSAEAITQEPGMLLLQSCLTLAIQELLANQSIDSFNQHSQGVAALLSLAGPKALKSQSVRHFYFEHRAMYIIPCMWERRSPYYAQKAWIEFPGKKSCKHAMSPYHQLVDVACLLPSVMESLDSEKDISVAGLRALLVRVSGLEHQMDEWRYNLSERTSYSLFVCAESKADVLFSDTIQFSSFNFATAIGYYFVFKIYCAQLTMEICERMIDQGIDQNFLLQQSLIKFVENCRLVCRTMEYYLDAERGFAGKLAASFPMSTACRSFRFAYDKYSVALDAEMEWCRQIALRFHSHGVTWISIDTPAGEKSPSAQQ